MIGKTDNPQSVRLPGLHAAPIATFYVSRRPQAAAPPQPLEPVPAEQLPPGTYLQYVGFGQTGGVREYYFRRVSLDGLPIEFVFSADMSLFAKCHVAIQEGPALCRHLLLERRDLAGAPAPRRLTESDMLAHLARHPAPQTKGKYRPQRAYAGGASDRA